MDTDSTVQLRPDTVLVDDGADEVHVLQANHTATFLNEEITKLVHAYAGLLAEPLPRGEAVARARAATGAEAELCSYVLDMLAAAGCLCPGGVLATDPLACFWSAQGRDGVGTLAQLATCEIVLVAPEDRVATAAESLARCGLTVTSHPAVPGTPADQLVAGVEAALANTATTLAVWRLPCHGGLTRALGDLALRCGRPALFGTCAGQVAHLGPFVIPFATACVECVSQRLLTHAGAVEARAVAALRAAERIVPPAAPVHPVFEQAMAGLFAVELSQICLDLPPTTLGAVVEYVHGQVGGRRRVVHRAPFCPSCHPPRPRPFGWDARFRGSVLAGEGG